MCVCGGGVRGGYSGCKGNVMLELWLHSEGLSTPVRLHFLRVSFLESDGSVDCVQTEGRHPKHE